MRFIHGQDSNSDGLSRSGNIPISNNDNLHISPDLSSNSITRTSEKSNELIAKLESLQNSKISLRVREYLANDLTKYRDFLNIIMTNKS
jgi:hypothetical protein